MSRDLPATVRGDRMHRGRPPCRPRRRQAPPRPPRAGGACLGGAWYVVGYRAAGTGPLPPTPVVLASCATRVKAVALAARFGRQLPQYARVEAERAGGR